MRYLFQASMLLPLTAGLTRSPVLGSIPNRSVAVNIMLLANLSKSSYIGVINLSHYGHFDDRVWEWAPPDPLFFIAAAQADLEHRTESAKHA
jgi:hypothetical protein